MKLEHLKQVEQVMKGESRDNNSIEFVENMDRVVNQFGLDKDRIVYFKNSRESLKAELQMDAICFIDFNRAIDFKTTPPNWAQLKSFSLRLVKDESTEDVIKYFLNEK
jgi:hypothetical protein